MERWLRGICTIYSALRKSVVVRNHNEMKKLIFRRLIAFGLDYIIIVLYALLLFGMTMILNSSELALTPISGQLLGFFSLTLAVFLYFFFSEKGRHNATLGKRIMNISVTAQSKNKQARILHRNILKFLPWEIAHTGVHWMVFYSNDQIDVPIWVWMLLIFPQIVMVTYFISIVTSKGESSIYDKISNTKIEMT